MADYNCVLVIFWTSKQLYVSRELLVFILVECRLSVKQSLTNRMSVGCDTTNRDTQYMFKLFIDKLFLYLSVIFIK